MVMHVKYFYLKCFIVWIKYKTLILIKKKPPLIYNFFLNLNLNTMKVNYIILVNFIC